MLKPGGQIEGDEALEFYAKHTAQIEVRGKSGGCREVAVGGGELIRCRRSRVEEKRWSSTRLRDSRCFD